MGSWGSKSSLPKGGRRQTLRHTKGKKWLWERKCSWFPKAYLCALSVGPCWSGTLAISDSEDGPEVPPPFVPGPGFPEASSVSPPPSLLPRRGSSKMTFSWWGLWPSRWIGNFCRATAPASMPHSLASSPTLSGTDSLFLAASVRGPQRCSGRRGVWHRTPGFCTPSYLGPHHPGGSLPGHRGWQCTWWGCNDKIHTCPSTWELPTLGRKGETGWKWVSIYWAPILFVVLEKILESPLDCKEIKQVNPKGNQPWIFTGRTDAETEAPMLWPPDSKSLTHWKTPWFWESLRAGGEWGWQTMRCLDDITDLMDMSLNKLRQMVKDGEAWFAAVHGVTKSWTRLSNWTNSLCAGRQWVARDGKTRVLSASSDLQRWDVYIDNSRWREWARSLNKDTGANTGGGGGTESCK